MSHEELALRVAALKVVSEFTTQKYNDARREIAAVMQRGDRLTARSPLENVKVGSVTMSDPKRVTQLTDGTSFKAWVAKHYPDKVVHELDIIGSDEEVKAVLFEHAPELIRKTSAVDPDFVKQVRSESAAVGFAVGPGGEVDVPGIEVGTPAAVVACRPDEGALAAVIDLFRSERLSLESLTMPELPGGAA